MRSLLSLVLIFGSVPSFAALDDFFQDLREDKIQERESKTLAVTGPRASELVETFGMATPVVSDRVGFGIAADFLYTEDKSSEVYFGALVGITVLSPSHSLFGFLLPSLLYRSNSFKNANPYFGVGAGIALDNGTSRFALLVRPGLNIGRDSRFAIETAIGVLDTSLLFMPRLSVSID